MNKRPTFEVLGYPQPGEEAGSDILRQLLTNSGWKFLGHGNLGAELTVVLPQSDPHDRVNKALVLTSSKLYSSRQLDGSLRPLVPMDEKELIVIDHLGPQKLHRNPIFAGVTEQQMWLDQERDWLNGGTPGTDVMILRMFPIATARTINRIPQSTCLEGSGRQVMTLLDRGDCEKYLERLVKRLMLGAFGVYNVGSRQTFTQLELAKAAAREQPSKWHHNYEGEPTIPLWEVPDMVRCRALTGLTFQERSMRAILKDHNVTRRLP